MQVSFGRKIPIMQCNIKDIGQNTFVPVKLSKFDCRDYKDIEEVAASCSKWCFIKNIIADMNKKFIMQNTEKEKFPSDYYLLENEQGKAIGLCETKSSNTSCNIEYLVSRHNNNYKYIGQALIAMVGKATLDRNAGRLFVANPAPSASGFYTNKCGFMRLNEYSIFSPLILDKDGIKKHINRFQNKTQAKILDIKV